MVNGQWISGEKNLKLELKRPNFPFSAKARIYTHWVSEGHFKVKSDSVSLQEVPVITFLDKTITKLERLLLSVEKRAILPDPSQMVQKIAMPKPDYSGLSVAFVKGFARDLGAVSIGICHESALPVVIGSNDKDMSLAFHWLAETGGGAVIIHNGQFLFELPFALGGMASNLAINQLAKELEKFTRILKDFGCPLDDPFLSFQFLLLTSLPYVRMTPLGLLDVIPFQLIST
jgi:adenine deaminase